MKSTWQGTITMGLISIPVNAYTATEDSGPALNYVHDHDGGRVSQQWVCKDCGDVVGWDHLGKGHEIGRNEDKSPIMVCLSPDELKSLDTKSREAQVIEFVTRDEVPTDLYGALYYLAPQPPAVKGQKRPVPGPSHTRHYTLLRESLRRTGLVALVEISLRNRPSRAMLYTDGDVIVMRTLLYPAQVRTRYFAGYYGGEIPAYEMNASELDEMTGWVRALAGKYDAARHVDPYATALTGLIDGKRPVVAAEPASNVVSIVDRLHAAVASAS